MFLNSQVYDFPIKKSINPIKQQGNTLIIAIFILVVVAALGNALLTISKQGNENITQEVLSIRALMAANSGADFALSQQFPLDNTTGTCAASSSWVPPTTWTPPSGSTLSNKLTGFYGCGVELLCRKYTVGEESIYKITSKATCEAGKTRASRTIVIEASDE